MPPMPFLLEHLKQEYTKKNERMGLNASQDTYLTYTHNKKKNNHNDNRMQCLRHAYVCAR